MLLKHLGEDASRVLADLFEEPYEILGHHPQIIAARKFVSRQARGYHTPVLVEGDPGTGKELVARAIHRQSSRRSRPFLWNHNVARAESPRKLLFGYEPASRKSHWYPGLIEQANLGTLFIGGVDELDLPTQRELLRFLETDTIRRVGSKIRGPMDTRLIFATRVSLEVAVSSGRFLEDLYNRIAGARVGLPKLSDRRQDIPLLAEEFVRQLAWHRIVKGLSTEAIAFLQRQPWPGGVTELKMVIRRAIETGKCEMLEVADVRMALTGH